MQPEINRIIPHTRQQSGAGEKNSKTTQKEMEQQPSGNNTLKGFSAAIVAAVCYGTNPLGTLKLYEDGFNSGTVLSYRYGLAVLMFALVMLIRKESFAIKWGHAIKFALLGTFFALSSITLYVSFHYMAAGIASTLLFVYPIMTALLMTAFFLLPLHPGIKLGYLVNGC